MLLPLLLLPLLLLPLLLLPLLLLLLLLQTTYAGRSCRFVLLPSPPPSPPPNPSSPQFLGHGIVDNMSKSVTLASAVHTASAIAGHCIEVRPLHVAWRVAVRRLCTGVSSCQRHLNRASCNWAGQAGIGVARMSFHACLPYHVL